MQTFVSGLSEQASFTALGGASGSAPLQWLVAGDFIAQALAAADDEPGGHWLWLYRAPWALLAQGGSQPSAEVLAQWQAQQRAVLQLRRHLRQRLILVNVDRVASPLLAERFGVPFIEGALPDEKPNTPLLSTLANLFEQMAPECWELYEALEAAAWLPEGEPEFRTNRALPRAAELTELLDLVRAGKQLAAVSQRLDMREAKLQQVNEQLVSAQAASETAERQAQQQLIEHQQALQAARTQAEALQAEKQSLTEENELLLNQLHQVQEELEKHYLDAVSLNEKQAALEKELAQSKAAHQQASKELTAASGKATEAEQARQKLAAELASLQQAKAELQANAQSNAEENELLLSQLHQVQEELEKHYLDGVSLKEKQAALEKELAQSKATDAEQARQKLAAELASLQKEKAELQAKAQSDAEENELLLNQLHQVQEELEKHYLNAVSLKEQQAALEKELAQSKAAHQQASKELAAASGKANEAEQARQKLAAELASLQQEKAELQANAKSNAEENELLLNQLHQVQEELENYYLANREILTVMGQSEQTLHRARGVIGRMAAHG